MKQIFLFVALLTVVAANAAPRKVPLGMKVVMQDQRLEKPAWYVVTPASGKGFFIMSGEDTEDAVIGYSDEGTVDAESMPPALREALDNYSSHVALVRQGLAEPLPSEETEEESNSRSSDRIPSSVSALISAQWSQGTPFNNLCPIKENRNCLVGCVALSMAQIMYYFKYPEYGTGTVSTRAEGSQLGSIDLDNTLFDYANMLDDYSDTYTDEQAQAAAMLCLSCGYAVNMQYGTDFSGAYQDRQRDVLINNFKYSHTARIIERVGTSLQNDTKWKKRLKEEIAAGRPIIVGGISSDNVAHNFICDGYQSLKFHINWGWGPKSNNITYNGWYNILNLTLPDGTSYSANAFTIGIEPAHDGEDASKQYFICANDSVADYSADAGTLDFVLPAITNATDSRASGSLYYVISDKDGNNAGSMNLTALSLGGKSSNSSQTANCTLPAGIADGVYYLSLGFKPDGSDCLQKVESMYNKTHLRIDVASGQVTALRAMTDDELSEEIATGISEVTNGEWTFADRQNAVENGFWPTGKMQFFNLSGQRVGENEKGLVIVNSKKVLR